MLADEIYVHGSRHSEVCRIAIKTAMGFNRGTGLGEMLGVRFMGNGLPEFLGALGLKLSDNPGTEHNHIIRGRQSEEGGSMVIIPFTCGLVAIIWAELGEVFGACHFFDLVDVDVGGLRGDRTRFYFQRETSSMCIGPLGRALNVPAKKYRFAWM